jgi:PPOX class probable F420-dependent enzyme
MSAEAMAVLRRPNFAHLATVRADGSPKLDPIWIDLLDDRTVMMASGRASLKTRNVLVDQRVAISVVDFDDPYEEVQLRGICSVDPDTDMAVMDRISHKYTGKPFPFRDNLENRVALRVDVTHCRYARLPFEHTPPR